RHYHCQIGQTLSHWLNACTSIKVRAGADRATAATVGGADPFGMRAVRSKPSRMDVTSGDPISAQTGAQRADFAPVLCPWCGVDINRSGLLAHYVVKKCNGHFGHQLTVADG